MAPAGLRIGFLGAGKMATALAQGWLKAGLVEPARLSASDPLPPARTAFAQATGATALDRNLDVVTRSDVILLAVKPQQMDALLAEIRPALTPQHLIVSIAAGITLSHMADALGDDRRIVRVMPNTPCLVGASASAFAAGPKPRPRTSSSSNACSTASARRIAVPETLLDAVTGLSGSGPAFVFVMIEALSDGGVRMGLPRDVGDAAGRPDASSAPRRWCSKRACIPASSRTWSPAPAAPPSPACTPSNAAACGRR